MVLFGGEVKGARVDRAIEDFCISRVVLFDVGLGGLGNSEKIVYFLSCCKIPFLEKGKQRFEKKFDLAVPKIAVKVPKRTSRHIAIADVKGRD